MAVAKSISNEMKHIASDAQAAGAEFTSAVAGDVREFAKAVGKSGGKTGAALQDEIEDLQQDVSRILLALRKLAGRTSDDVSAAAHQKLDELTADAKRAGTAAKKSALWATGAAETAIIAHPFASILISVGAGFLLSHMMRR